MRLSQSNLPIGDPLISIITPIYNGLEFFPDTVASVQEQTRDDWEWLVVDDGSTDGTWDYCLNISRCDPRIRVLRHPNGSNCGQSASRNLGIRHASGDFIALLDCDDLWVPEKLDRDLATFARHPRANFLYSRILNWYDWRNSPEVNIRNQPGVLGTVCDQLLEPPQILLHLLRNLYDSACQFPATCSLMMRRSALPEGDELFDSKYRGGFEDIVMLTKVLLHHPAVVCDDIRSFYRRHPRSFTAASDHCTLDDEFHFISRWINLYVASSPKCTRDAVAHALEAALERGARHRRKMKLLAAARKILPLQFREWLWQNYGKRGLVGR